VEKELERARASSTPSPSTDFGRSISCASRVDTATQLPSSGAIVNMVD